MKDTGSVPFTEDSIRKVKEGSSISQKVGMPLLSSDPDILSREQLLYRLTATASVPFRIDGCSGQMRVAQESLNFEAQNKYNVTVTVTDNSNLEETATVTVLVQDINEPPHFKSPLIEKNIQETAWHPQAGAIKNENGIMHVHDGLCCLNLSYARVNFVVNQTFLIVGTENSLLNGVLHIHSTPPPLPLSFCFQTELQTFSTGTVSSGGSLMTYEAGSKLGEEVFRANVRDKDLERVYSACLLQ